MISRQEMQDAFAQTVGVEAAEAVIRDGVTRAAVGMKDVYALPEIIRITMTLGRRGDLAGTVAYTFLFRLLDRMRKDAETRATEMEQKLEPLQEESERQQKILASVIEGMDTGTWEWNLQTGEIETNRRWAQILGYSLEELAPLSAATWTQRAHPDDIKRWQELLDKHVTGKTDLFECEIRLRHKDGRWVWVLDRGRVTEWTDNRKPLLMYGTRMDITQMRGITLKLEESERNFRAFFDSVGDIFVVAKPNGVLLHANAAATRLLGYSIQELRGRHILDIHPPDRRAEAERIFEEMLEGTRAYCPLPLQRRDGSTLRVESRIWGGQWNGENCVYGLSKDVSEQEAALQKFDCLFESNPALMAVSRASDGTFTDVNAAFLKTLGYSREEVLGHTSEDLRLFPDAEAHGAIVRELQRCGRVRDVRLPVRTRDGRTIKGLFAGEIVENQGEHVFLTVMIDITALENAQEVMRQWNAFQGEINTLSQQLVNLPWQDVDAGITAALGRIGSFVRAHRAYLFLFREDGMMDNTHEWCADGVEPQIDNLKNQDMNMFPWWIERLRAGQTICVPRVTDMGPEAAAEKAILEMQDIASILVVPLDFGEKTGGFLGFDSVRQEREWPEYAPILLRVVGDILSGVLLRKRTDRVLHEANARLEARVEERTRVATKEAANARSANEALRLTVDTLTETNRELEATQGALQASVEHLKTSEERYRLAVRATRDVVWEFDCVGNCKSWSILGNTLFGWQADEAHPRDASWWMDKVHPEDRPGVERLLTQSLTDPAIEDLQTEYRFRRENGRYAHVHDRCRIVRGQDGRALRLIGAMQDNTEAVRREAHYRQSQKLQAIGRLAAGVAHELNNPLGFLMNNFSALEDDVAAFRTLIAGYRVLRQRAQAVPALAREAVRLEEQEKAARLDFILEDLDTLFAESRDGFQRATAIVDSLRSFARSERSEEKTEYDLNEGVKSTLVLARNEYKYHSVIETEYGDIPRVLCVPGQISQVLLNLVVNAAQAIAAQKRGGNGAIRVRTFADDEWVCCDVADNGPGIPDDVIEKIMEPFFTTKPPGQGTGLGLAISYDIVVNRHCGKLTVDSREGEGAVFHVQLPRKASE